MNEQPDPFDPFKLVKCDCGRVFCGLPGYICPECNKNQPQPQPQPQQQQQGGNHDRQNQ